MIIVGAGLSGLIAGCIFKDAKIVEEREEPSEGHRALLRFRSDVVSQITGVPFRKVTVRKGLWSEGAFRGADIRLANLYSIKTLGILAPRSIWSLEAVERFIAPNDFYDQLLEIVGRHRIIFDEPFYFSQHKGDVPVISTAPMFVPAEALLKEYRDRVDFRYKEIHVLRGKVKDCDVHQTVYYPSPDHPLYRASITGDDLIMEFNAAPTMRAPMAFAWEEFLSSFGLEWEQITLEEKAQETTQRFGKIAEIDDDVRRIIINKLSSLHNIFSLGRFATWRNILLDDVVNDCHVIQRLIKAGEYEQTLIQSLTKR